MSEQHPAEAATILVIEDDPGIAQGLIASLEREGFRVMHRSGGRQGIACARDQHPHLIILDVRLPDGSGLDFCRELRQMGVRQPILMLTVLSDEIDKVLGLEMGADDYLTKPYSTRELLARIRAMLRRNYGELSSEVSELLFAGDLVINRASGQVMRGSELISLTPTEFRLLLYLARHAGQALTRGQLLDEVWGYSSGVEDEQIATVYIRRLREKLEYDPARPTLILTVPGVGYRLSR